jgi:glutamine phosphoribosylpyrophosphate amidotransferase
MCAIVGSFDKDKLKELIELNCYRGNHSYSISEYTLKTKSLFTTRGLGDFPFEILKELKEGKYYIAHTQAPTTDAKSTSNIHPHRFNDDYMLWHNGIIKESFVKKMQNQLNTAEKWDTALLNEWVYNKYDLGEVDGTFSCLRFDKGKLILFRNEISPMFIDKDFNISSTKFKNSNPTPAGKELYMRFNVNSKSDIGVLVEMGEFKTKENPYFFLE